MYCTKEVDIGEDSKHDEGDDDVDKQQYQIIPYSRTFSGSK